MEIAPQLKLFDPGAIATRLKASDDPCQQRQGGDIEELLAMAQGPWAGSVAVRGVAPAADGALCVAVELANVEGLLYDAGQMRPNRTWQLALLVPPSYPHHMPNCKFLGAVPFAPHTIHAQCLIAESDLPPQLLGFLRALRSREEGWTCYLENSQWSPLRTHNLCLVLWLVSRIVCGARFRGEQASLNSLGVNHFAQLAREGRLPLGPPLSYPAGDDRLETCPTEDDDEDIAWIEEE